MRAARTQGAPCRGSRARCLRDPTARARRWKRASGTGLRAGAGGARGPGAGRAGTRSVSAEQRGSAPARHSAVSAPRSLLRRSSETREVRAGRAAATSAPPSGPRKFEPRYRFLRRGRCKNASPSPVAPVAPHRFCERSRCASEEQCRNDLARAATLSSSRRFCFMSSPASPNHWWVSMALISPRSTMGHSFTLGATSSTQECSENCWSIVETGQATSCAASC